MEAIMIDSDSECEDDNNNNNDNDNIINNDWEFSDEEMVIDLSGDTFPAVGRPAKRVKIERDSSKLASSSPMAMGFGTIRNDHNNNKLGSNGNSNPTTNNASSGGGGGAADDDDDDDGGGKLGATYLLDNQVEVVENPTGSTGFVPVNARATGQDNDDDMDRTTDWSDKTDKAGDDDEVCLVGVANENRLPHARHDCPNHRHSEWYVASSEASIPSHVITQNCKSCDLCFCYVCDKPAKECPSWGTRDAVYPDNTAAKNHCCATDRGESAFFWKTLRAQTKAKQKQAQINNNNTNNNTNGNDTDATTALQDFIDSDGFLKGNGPFPPGVAEQANPSLGTPSSCRWCSWSCFRNNHILGVAAERPSLQDYCLACGRVPSVRLLRKHVRKPTKPAPWERLPPRPKTGAQGAPGQKKKNNNKNKAPPDIIHSAGNFGVGSTSVFGGNNPNVYQEQKETFLIWEKEVPFRIRARDPRKMKRFKSRWEQYENTSPGWTYSQAAMEKEVYEHRLGGIVETTTILRLVSPLQVDKLPEDGQFEHEGIMNEPDRKYSAFETDSIIFEDHKSISLFLALEMNCGLGKAIPIEISSSWNEQQRQGVGPKALPRKLVFFLLLGTEHDVPTTSSHNGLLLLLLFLL